MSKGTGIRAVVALAAGAAGAAGAAAAPPRRRRGRTLDALDIIEYALECCTASCIGRQVQELGKCNGQLLRHQKPAGREPLHYAEAVALDPSLSALVERD